MIPPQPVPLLVGSVPSLSHGTLDWAGAAGDMVACVVLVTVLIVYGVVLYPKNIFEPQGDVEPVQVLGNTVPVPSVTLPAPSVDAMPLVRLRAVTVLPA